ncbi:hypothetical protein BJ508DRAFT_419540 [Ascobolus immersus RN42]|uniref:F-box domain-containing protein n=1 Tax=Ascobolus immersus RN42 TaxID=1160509 RepID=A0A3N4HRJ0_ASCIM|nr:hypothetical protein BJ508DRAFT_419540 [Ascobolus immersus RN42]
MASDPESLSTSPTLTGPPFYPTYNPQHQSPLFRLPPELRLAIYTHLLTPQPDLEHPYPFRSYYYRPPTDIAKVRVYAEVLRSCKRAWMEGAGVLWKQALVNHTETFYWGWEERRPVEFRHWIGDREGKNTPAAQEGRIWEEDEEDEEMEDDGYSDEEEEMEEGGIQMAQPGLEPGEIPLLIAPMNHPSIQFQNRLEAPDPDVSDDDSEFSEYDGLSDEEMDEAGEAHDWWPNAVSSASETSSPSPTRASLYAASRPTPYKSVATDHPFQHPRHRSYLPHQWSQIQSLRIFPQLFSFSPPTFSHFFKSQPLLRPQSVSVVVRYTDWWSWEDNVRLDICLGMRPGFGGVVILPETVREFVLELETIKLKEGELEEVVRGIEAESEEWRWARTDGTWLEYGGEIGFSEGKQREWEGPAVFYDEAVEDAENIYGGYRFPHHGAGEGMRYISRRLVWREGEREEGVEDGEVVEFGGELAGWGEEEEMEL